MATRTASDHRYIQVELGWCPGRIFVTGAATRCGRNMRRALASGTDTVMATGTVGGTGESAVVSLGAGPDCCRFVTTFARSGSCQVGSGLAGGRSAVVAARATRTDRYIGVEFGWRPGRVALVTSRAVGRGREVVGTLARCVGPVMATGAVGGTGKGTVIDFGTSPDAGRFVATLATCCR